MENKVNLNLINTLILLKKYRSMRKVAKVLGKSESAISKDLTKLRLEFSDNLFVKTQNGFEPTSYLNDIYQELERAYTQLITIVNKPVSFEPHRYKGLITIAIADAEYDQIVASLYAKLIQVFPEAKFNLVTWDQNSLNKLLNGEITCGIHLQNNDFSKDIYQKTLKTDQIVPAVHKQHQVTDWEGLKRLPFVFIDVPGWNEFNYRIEDVLPKEIKSNIGYKVRVDKLKAALQIASKSKVAIQAPTKFFNDDFTIIPYPDGIRFDVAYSFYCSQTERDSPLVKILIELIKECYAEL